MITSGDAPLYTALKNAEPGVRAEAIEEVISRGLPNVSSVIADALVDGDPAVRERALTSAVLHGADIPDALVLRLAQTDTAPEVRLAALRAFNRLVTRDREAVRSAAQYAVNDADPSVQSAAHEILSHLAATDNAPDGFDFMTTDSTGTPANVAEDAAP